VGIGITPEFRMSSDRYAEARALSRFAAEMEPDVRASFLRQACGDEELRAQAEMFVALRGEAEGRGVAGDGQPRPVARRHGLKVTAALAVLTLLGCALVAAWQAVGAAVP
jgi:hypothetical protein